MRWAQILYEVLTDRPPFKGTTVLDTLDQVRNREPVLPSRLHAKLPRDLETICLKCLRKESASRYCNAANLADDLRRFLAGKPIRARPAGLISRVGPWCRRPERVTQAGLMLLIFGSCFTFWCLISAFMLLFGQIKVDRPAEALAFGGTMMAVFYAPMIGLGVMTLRKPRTSSLWTGLVLTLSMFFFVIGYNLTSFDGGGLYKDKSVLGHVIILFFTVALVQVAACGVAIHSFHFNRRASLTVGKGHRLI